MRALAAFEPSDWLSPAAARDADELERLGYRRNTDSPSIRKFLDPIEDDKRRPKGEDPRGIEVRRHPHAWLRDTPAVWDVADELMDGVIGDLTREDRARLSEAEWSLIATFKAAEGRKLERQLKPPKKPGPKE